MTHLFPPVDHTKTLPQLEEDVLAFWKAKHIFQKTIDARNPNHEFVFLDGPPFATGTPHYGHILAGAIKDAIPRYKTMQGYRVERKFGWDCHGLPVEFQVEKEHEIGGKPGIEKMGIGKFNELCRSIVFRCRDQWEHVVERMGRFVDFQDDYKTMDVEFMESVWWVFSELDKKGLIYEGEKVVPYSSKLGSPLSNFEANLNYKDIDDPAVTARFELADEPGTFILAWTTTPWTLPSNLALCVHPKLNYVQLDIQGTKESVIVAEDLKEKFIELYQKEHAQNLVPSKTMSGKDLIGKSYQPLFDFFAGRENAHRVVGDDFVSAEDGTGIVHLAPTGEDDARILQKEKVKLTYPFDENGYFDDTIPELTGKYFRSDPEVEDSKENNANEWVIENLKERGLLAKPREQIRHSYPHCWRTDCALMYRGIKTWFVDVQKIKKDLIAQNKNTNWVPGYLKDGRFGKGLENAPDWAISRNRYWGTPMPVWRCDKTNEMHIVGSREELETLTGQEITDLHKHFVDDLTWKNEKTGGTMRRIPEVFDCWVESGSMPYASVHYPFSGNEFKTADFIAEGLDQTRCWFYVLHVLGVGLLGKNVFDNVITNGIVLAEDGQKMSKSKKNYPDPQIIFDNYGADAMRFYLLSSPVVRGENLRFSEKGVEEVLKSIILPIRSAYQFFSTYANVDQWKPTQLVFLRHGQSEANVAKIYSGQPDNQHSLTDLGRQQVQDIAPAIPEFDCLVSSPFVRTRETAAILKKESGFTGEIEIDERIQEPHFGDLEGKPWLPSTERIANTTTEHPLELRTRVQDFFTEAQQKYEGKTVVVVSHGSPSRAMQAIAQGANELEQILMIPYLQTGKFESFFAEPRMSHELDRWIVSELQTLLQHVRTHLDAYDLEGALRPIPAFIDKLNNGYLRRSRRRFWASGMSEDKKSAYETLHYVLLTFSKIMAPMCPFFTEKMYQDLGGAGSVHLEFFPYPRPDQINKDIENRIGLEREIVSLACSIRGREKIKLRQPLGTLKLLMTENIDLDFDAIASEANVKTIEMVTSLEGVAQKIVRVNAKAVGPRLGKKVQSLIVAGKAGDFTELDNGQVQIGDEVLENTEYEIGYSCTEGSEAEASPRVVVVLDTEITDELKLEGMARELIRTIQDLRKSNGFEVADRISVQYSTDSEMIEKAFTTFNDMIAGEVLAESLESVEKLENGESCEVEGEGFEIQLTKV